MKGSKVFAIGITALLVIMACLQLHIPQRFSWQPTFLTNDPNPFGCYVFDSIMAQTMPDGYSVTSRTLAQISRDRKRQNVLVVTDKYRADSTDMAAIKRITSDGGKVMLVACRKDYQADSLMLCELGAYFRGYMYFSIENLRRKIKDNTENVADTIFWTAVNEPFGERIYPVYDMMADNWINISEEKKSRILATVENRPVAARLEAGRGEVIIVSTPLLFTNYGVLDNGVSEYVFRLMSHIADGPVVRTMAYTESVQATGTNTSPLRFILSRPPLRTALFLTIIVIVLLLTVGARRRQGIIPVIEPPHNRSLEFVQLIGTLSFHRKNHADIVRRKYTLFTEELKRLLMIDISDESKDADSIAVIARQTGIEVYEVEQMIRDIRLAVHYDMNISAADMRRCIDYMNIITGKIT